MDDIDAHSGFTDEADKSVRELRFPKLLPKIQALWDPVQIWDIEKVMDPRIELNASYDSQVSELSDFFEATTVGTWDDDDTLEVVDSPRSGASVQYDDESYDTTNATVSSDVSSLFLNLTDVPPPHYGCPTPLSDSDIDEELNNSPVFLDLGTLNSSPSMLSPVSTVRLLRPRVSESNPYRSRSLRGRTGPSFEQLRALSNVKAIKDMIPAHIT